MLNSGKKIRALHTKKINILTRVLSEKKILNETKNHNPPCKLNGQSLKQEENHGLLKLAHSAKRNIFSHS
jgi:hypothetical protein